MTHSYPAQDDESHGLGPALSSLAGRTIAMSAEAGGPHKSSGSLTPSDSTPGMDVAGVVQRFASTYEPVLVEPRQSGHTAILPFTAGYAARTLGVNKRQMEKLIGCGLVHIAETTDGGHRRVNGADIFALALRTEAGAPAPGDLAVHLAPLATDSEPVHQRSHVGWHTDAAGHGVSAQAIEDAWAGLWKVDPEPHIGAALVGDVAGFVVAVGVITGYRRVAGRIRFIIDAPTPDVTRRYAGKRFNARPGDMVQRLYSSPTT